MGWEQIGGSEAQRERGGLVSSGKGTTTTTINVRQRQYAIASADSDTIRLVTRNILACTAWFGIDRHNGIAFLCHFDTPWSPAVVPQIVRELMDIAPNNAQFESHIVNGTFIFSPWSFFTRRRLKSELRKMSEFKCTLTEHRFLLHRLRSLVCVSLTSGSWRRVDYCREDKYKEAKAIRKGMSKALGSL